MTPTLSRRTLFGLAGCVWLRGAERWEPRVAENIGDLSDGTLRWLAQMGHRWVVLQGTDKVDAAGKGYWSVDDVRAVQARCRTFGMELHSLMLPIGWLRRPMLGTDGRDGDIANIARSIEAAGAAGVRMMEWRWSPDFVWGADAGYFDEAGRGGAVYKAYDYARVKDAAPYAELGTITRAQLWERMEYFLERALPAAEKVGVKMSLHPKDPPVRVLRGIERLFTNTAEIEKFALGFQSKANGFTFCQGTVTEMGVDVVDAIRRIGGKGRIHHVHFRNVRGRVPRYTETFIDDGDMDMLAAMRAYREVGYQGSLVSDHSPSIPGDLPGGKIGRSFSQGYIRGLVQAADGPARGSAGSVRMKVALGLGLSERAMRFSRMVGVEHVVMPAVFSLGETKRGLVPAADRGPRPEQRLRAWDAAELKRIRDHLAAAGLRGEMIHLGQLHRIALGMAGADEEMGAVKKCIAAAGEAGVPVVEYNFFSVRASEGYGRTTGRGGAGLRDFDASRIAGLAPLENVGTHSREQMWGRLTAFLKEIVPVAEKHGVRLAVHPNDPPVETYRGAAQPLRSLADLKRLITTVDSPANGITLDTGVMTEMGEDAVAAVRYFGQRGRIHHVHFRNVRVTKPYVQYVETFHDEGECDMAGAMRALREVGYGGLILPDHTPEFSGDTPMSEMGWAFAVGYMQALRRAAERP